MFHLGSFVFGGIVEDMACNMHSFFNDSNYRYVQQGAITHKCVQHRQRMFKLMQILYVANILLSGQVETWKQWACLSIMYDLSPLKH